MPSQPATFSESANEPLRSRDMRVGILAFLALSLFALLCCKIFETTFIALVPAPPSVQLIAYEGVLSLVDSGEASRREDDGTGVQHPDLTPFVFLPIPVNFADARLLETVDGIGPHLAEEIVRTRTARGFFTDANALLSVPGIGPKRSKQLEKHFSFRTRL